MSDTDEEDHSKTVVNVYDLSWRSAELKHLLRNVLDLKSASTKAPNWTCNEQDVIYDTEFVQTEGEDESSFASTSSETGETGDIGDIGDIGETGKTGETGGTW
ncbi:hypothetical protein Glove_162g90 [Diversispora epigaea]|uniref:Uncharacterized protein n=1 Tax=Diversispora epigaea TaxID=1348612 RepID=A0A397IR67_9GLOM|nr:hypothetical protein Glove_162g90 [Diversispora epigaea]